MTSTIEQVKPAHPKELGAFLRAHRECRNPGDVGLRDIGRRRTPGLRREEVATLSGVGVAWYTWLEQGRIVPSKKVLDSVARTLGLHPASYRHLLALAGLLPGSPIEADHQKQIAPGTQELLDSWESSPAVLLDCRFDITAWNAAYAAVWFDPELVPAIRRNLMWFMAGGVPNVQETVEYWESLARATLAQFRAQTARRAEDPRTRELYAVLNEDFPELSGWWQCQGVDDLRSRPVSLRVAGRRLQLKLFAFRPVDDPEALILVQTPARDADRTLIENLVRISRPPLQRAG